MVMDLLLHIMNLEPLELMDIIRTPVTVGLGALFTWSYFSGEAPGFPQRALTTSDVHDWALLWHRLGHDWEQVYPNSKLEPLDRKRLIDSSCLAMDSMERYVLQDNQKMARWENRFLNRYLREWNARLAGQGVNWKNIVEKINAKDQTR